MRKYIVSLLLFLGASSLVAQERLSHGGVELGLRNVFYYELGFNTHSVFRTSLGFNLFSHEGAVAGLGPSMGFEYRAYLGNRKQRLQRRGVYTSFTFEADLKSIAWWFGEQPNWAVAQLVVGPRLGYLFPLGDRLRLNLESGVNLSYSVTDNSWGLRVQTDHVYVPIIVGVSYIL